jgi:hypothetical protein
MAKQGHKISFLKILNYTSPPPPDKWWPVPKHRLKATTEKNVFKTKVLTISIRLHTLHCKFSISVPPELRWPSGGCRLRFLRIPRPPSLPQIHLVYSINKK